jgi:hypothetical protein
VPSNGTVVKIFTHPENTNMFHVGRFRLFHAGRRALRRERVFRDRTKPLDIYHDFELIDKYRFYRQSIIPAKHVPSNGTVVKIFTHPENDLDGEFYVHVRYDMDLFPKNNLKLRKLRPSYLSGIHKRP